MLDPDAAANETDYGQVMDAFAMHEAELLRLLEASTGKPVDWIKSAR